MPVTKKKARGEVLTVKVTYGIRKRLKQVCDAKGLQIGRVVEHAILERLEDLEDEEWAMRTISDRLNEETVSIDEAFKHLKISK